MTINSNNQATMLLRAYMASQMVFVACQLDIASLLGSEEKSYKEIAEKLALPETAVLRFLRGLVLCHFVKEKDGKQFILTDIGHCFHKEAEGSLYGFAMQNSAFYRAWGELLGSLSSGKTGFELAFGEKLFDYLSSHPEFEREFNLTMDQNMLRMGDAVVGLIDFSEYSEFIDIGGCTGTLARVIKANYPHLQAKVFERESVVKALTRNERKGIEFIIGDFFEEVPISSGIYILSHVLHDWNDEECRLILNNCSKQMLLNSRMLIVEQLMPEIVTSYHPAVEFDINMLLLTGGKERTLKEYAALLESSGLQLVRTDSVSFCNNVLQVIKS